MQTSSADGKRDAIVGLLFLIIFTVGAYLGLTNIHLFYDNILLIIIIVFIGSLAIILIPFIFDLIKSAIDYAGIVKNSEDYTVKDPEMPDQSQQ